MTTAREWLEEVRALDLETLTRLGVRFGPTPAGERVAIPYVANGEVRRHKIRAPGDRPYWSAGGDVTLWNVDILADRTLAEQPVILTEGEYDALACIQVGFVRTVSVPHGAQSAVRYVLDHSDRLRQSPCVIIAADGDDDGAAMLRSVANALEGHPCRYLAYPEGCKDANDVLARHGADALVRLVNAAPPVFPDDPAGGIITGFSDAPPPPDGAIYRAGDPGIDRMCCFHVGFPTIVTGVPGSGKSTWLTWVLDRTIQNHGIRVGACLLETPWPILRDQLARMQKGHGFDELHRDQKEEFSRKIDDEWRLMHRVEGAAHDLGWWKQMMWAAAVRDGCKIVALDPWNEVEHAMQRGEAMTDYVNAALSHVHMWAERYGCAVAIVAHPTKMQRDPGSKPYAPTGYDIAGSAAWYNKAAVGVTIHRESDDDGQFTRAICWKSKFTQLYNFDRGQVKLLYDPVAMVFRPRPKMTGSAHEQ